MTTLFSGSDLFVECSTSHPTHAPVAVTFSSYNGGEDAPFAFGRPFVERQGFNGVYFVASRNHWWQTPEMGPALAAARAHMAGLTGKRVLYGSSMGAYGALLFARDLDATRVVAVSPQTHLTGEPTDFMAAWRDCLVQRPVLRDDIHASLRPGMDIRVVIDPRDRIDLRHLKHLEARLEGRGVALTCYLAPFATHAVLGYLKRTRTLGPVLSGLLKGHLGVPEFRRIIRDTRRDEISYFERAAAIARHRRRPVRAERLAAEADRLQAA